MDPFRLLLRAKRLAQNPPSASRVKLVLGVIVACLALAGAGYLFGEPEWMTRDRVILRQIGN